MDRLQAWLDQAVERGAGPFWGACLVTKDGVLPAKISGADPTTGEPIKADDLFWLASGTKVCIALSIIATLEQGLVEGVTDVATALNDPDTLTRFCPELKLDSGHPFTKIWDDPAWEGDPMDRNYRPFKQATKPITLRNLMNWTAGSMGLRMDHNMDWLHSKGNRDAPHLRFDLCHNDHLRDPRLGEAGETFSYGGAGHEWLGIWLTCATGMTQRHAVQRFVVQPLGLSSDDLNHYLTDDMRKRKLTTYTKSGLGWTPAFPPGFPATSFWPDEPPDGFHHYANAGMFGTLTAFATVLQAMLTRDKRVLTKQSWDLMLGDDWARRPDGPKSVPQLLWTGDHAPQAMCPVRMENDDMGVALIQGLVERKATSFGYTPGTIHWFGSANMSWFCDSKTGIAGLVSTQTIPFYAPAEVGVMEGWIKLAYEHVQAASRH